MFFLWQTFHLLAKRSKQGSDLILAQFNCALSQQLDLAIIQTSVLAKC